MVRIKKPAKAPGVLGSKGQPAKEALCAAYDQCPGDYDSGKLKLAFDSSIYGGKTVKNALIKAQHGKCCFCESKVGHIDHGDIEHFRPKGAYKQSEEKKLQYPGYYWLAYDWNNLYFACAQCNQTHKRNLFPLEDPVKRARNQHQDISGEKPLLIDPGNEDPGEFIGFRAEVAYAIEGNARGEFTITCAGLNRQPLQEQRRERYAMLKALHDVVRLSPDSSDAKKALKLLQERRQPNREYSAMAKAAIENCFSLP